MKRIINGRRYDTETAKRVGWYDNGLRRKDLNFIEEELYLKRTGEFFISGMGGAMTKYAESCGNNFWSGGEAIIPVTADEARRWAEEHLTADEYEDLFGKVEEDESRKVVTYSLPVATIEKVKKAAAERGVSFSDIVAEAIEAIL